MRYYVATFPSLPDLWCPAGLVDARGEVIDELAAFLGSAQLSRPTPFRYLEHRTKRWRPYDWGWSIWSNPILSERAATVVQGVASQELRLFPVQVPEMDEVHFLVHVLARPDCIDHDRSGVGGDPIPAGLRVPRGTYPVCIDVTRAKRFHLFRPRDWPASLIVSDRLRRALKGEGVRGIGYLEVLPSVAGPRC